MKSIKSHFEIHSRFRNGIFLLSTLLFLLLLVYYFYPYAKDEPDHFVELIGYQSQIDSLKLVAVNEKYIYFKVNLFLHSIKYNNNKSI